jgi:hypothetical protein
MVGKVGFALTVLALTVPLPPPTSLHHDCEARHSIITVCQLPTDSVRSQMPVVSCQNLA